MHRLDRVNQTLSASFDRLLNRVTILAATLGERLAPIVRDNIQFFDDLVRSTQKLFATGEQKRLNEVNDRIAEITREISTLRGNVQTEDGGFFENFFKLPQNLVDEQIAPLQEELRQLFGERAQLEASESGKEIGRKLVGGINDGVVEAAATTDLSITLKGITDQLFNVGATTEELKKKVATETAQIASLFKQTIGGGVSQAFASFGRAVATGQNGLEALGNSVLQTLGGLAIQLGQFFILVGTGLTATTALFGISGGAAIAAGIALSALGGALQAIGGGGAGATGGVGGGAATPSEDTFFDEEPETQEPGQQIAINVEGTVVDPVSTGQQIAEVLQIFFDSTGSQIVTTG